MIPFPLTAESVRTRIRFGGMPIDPMSVDEAADALARRPADAPFAIYVTPNVEFIHLQGRHPEMGEAIETSYLSTNDSRILHRLGRWAGIDLKFAPGAYVVDRLFRTVIQPDDPILILGGTAAMADDFRKSFGLRRLVQYAPPMGFVRDPAAVQAAVDVVARHPSRFVMVAMGPPQSEMLCRRIAVDGRSTGLGLCIGSSLQVLTGHIGRAPDWMENSGLVWLHRLGREPARLWRRYLVHDVVGLAICLREIMARRLNLGRAVA